MCLAIPLKIESINAEAKTALCSSMGMRREVRIDFIGEPQIGDYVIVHAGFAIEKLDEKQALEDLQAWEDVKNALES